MDENLPSEKQVRGVELTLARIIRLLWHHEWALALWGTKEKWSRFHDNTLKM